MKTTVLFPGSFNPIHYGHMAVAEYLASQPEVDEVRLIVSPHNPLKGQATVTAEERLSQVKDTISTLPPAIASRITVSDIEFSLPEPRYTLNTLRALRTAEPQTRFILAVGGDNILILEKWHRWEEILATTELWVYPRPGYPGVEERIKELSSLSLLPAIPHGTSPSTPVTDVRPAIRFLDDAPQNDISSTMIRNKK